MNEKPNVEQYVNSPLRIGHQNDIETILSTLLSYAYENFLGEHIQ